MRHRIDTEHAVAAPVKRAGAFFVVLTPPSALAATVLHAIQAMAERALGPVDMLKLSTLDALRSEMLDRKNRHLILYSDCPAPEAVELINKTSPPVLIFADDPVRVAKSIQSNAGHDLPTSFRTTSLSFATLHDLVLQSKHKAVLSPPDYPSMVAFLAETARFLSLSISSDELAAVAREFDNRGEWGAVVADDSSVTLGRGIVSPFRSIYEFKAADEFYWPPALFFGTDPLGSPLQKQIDLTGPARPILYGPFMHLPLGDWQATVRFAISENKSGNAVLVEWLVGSEIDQSARISTLPETGQFQFSLYVKIFDPREPLQIRISILEGAIEGRFEFQGVRLSRHVAV